MPWFETSKRKRLLSLLKEFFEEGHEFRDLIDKWNRCPRDVKRKDIRDEQKKVRKMIVQDAAIIHLLVELRRKGLINFKEGQGQEILTIAKELLEISKEFYSLFDHMLDRTDIPWDIPRSFIIYQNKLSMLVRSEKKSIEDLEKGFRKGVQISEKKLFSVKGDGIRVELHRFPKFVGYLTPFDRRGSPRTTECIWGLLIFHNDFLVAEAYLGHYDKKDIHSDRLITYVRGKGYHRRSIKLLLTKRKIKVWESDTSLTPEAKKMFRKLKEDPELKVVWKNRRYYVSLN